MKKGTSRSKGLVMRSLVEVIPTGDVYHEYWLLKTPTHRKAVTRHEAEDYIKENGLVEVLDCEFGQIYDTPDRAFYNEWKGWCKKNYISLLHVWG